MSRYAPGHKQEAKARILAAVGRGFRKRGYGGIGVDGLAKEADVTSGALYGHFRSKEDAFKEAVVAGIDELAAAIVALRAEHGANWIETFVDFYLGQKRVCDLGESCALQSLRPRFSVPTAKPRQYSKPTWILSCAPLPTDFQVPTQPTARSVPGLFLPFYPVG